MQLTHEHRHFTNHNGYKNSGWWCSCRHQIDSQRKTIYSVGHSVKKSVRGCFFLKKKKKKQSNQNQMIND